MKLALAAVASLAVACGGSAKPATIGATGEAAPRPLADDLAELSKAIATKGYYPKHVAILGWTDDHHLVYRATLCVQDELGGRGDACDLLVCTASGVATDANNCMSAASFELAPSLDYEPAVAKAEAEAMTDRLAPRPGRALGVDALPLTIERGALYVRAGADDALVADSGANPEVPDAAILDVTAAAASTSPDGACQAVVGLFTHRVAYEGVYGRVPRVFGAVVCAK